MATIGTQSELRLAWGMQHAPSDAPAKVVGQVEDDAQALRIMIRAGGHKLENIAAAIGKSRSYVSRLQNDKRPIPDRLVGPLCAATGSNLLRQYRDLQRALHIAMGDHVLRLADELRRAA